ncbi:MAG: hypothetical protein H7831_01140 [Magnetococcus sp. WYHC-3]
MSDSGNLDRTLSIIPVTRETDQARESGQPGGRKLKREEDWELNVNALRRFSSAGDWKESLNILKYLSTKEWHPHVNKAMAQRLWLVLKGDFPVSEVVVAFYHLMIRFGSGHDMAGTIAASANLMAHHRTPEDPDRELAQMQAYRMLRDVADTRGIQGQQAFEDWQRNNGLDDPDVYLPRLLTMLDQVVDGHWWLDRDLLQADLERSNAQRQNTLQ